MLVLRSPFCLEGGSQLARGHQVFRPSKKIRSSTQLLVWLPSLEEGVPREPESSAWAGSCFVGNHITLDAWQLWGNSTKNMPGGVREHIPVISVEVGEVEYAKFAYNKENAFSVCLICHHCSRAKASEAYLPEAASLFLTSTLTSTDVWLAWKRKGLIK